MRPWQFPISLSPESGDPLYRQICRAVSADIRRGRLRGGDALPGSRTLARELGVHRNTVLAAFQELEAEGWIHSKGRATVVALEPPMETDLKVVSSDRLGFDLSESPCGWALDTPTGERDWSALPDLAHFPLGEFQKAIHCAMKDPSLLDYSDVRGDSLLRCGLSDLLSDARGIISGPERLLVTSGSQMALELVARALVRPGDSVVVENPGYPAAWTAFREAGAQLVPVPVDEEGLRVEELEALASQTPIRAVFVTPNRQFPTMVTLSANRRRRLLDCAVRHRMAVVEDDYDFEFHYGGRPVMPLATLDHHGVVVYLGTFSKVLAPGLRLGFVSGSPRLIEALARRRHGIDFHGSPVIEHAVGVLLQEGLLQRHARRMRKVYSRRRETLAQAMEKHLSGHVFFERPSGGMAFWVRAAPKLFLDGWLLRTQEAGIHIRSGRSYEFRGACPGGFRLGFSRQREVTLERAVQVMASLL